MIFNIFNKNKEPNACLDEDELFIKDTAEKYYNKILGFCVTRTKNVEDAKDVTQSVFTTLIESFSKNREKVDRERVLAWLYSTACKKLKEYGRAKTKELLAECDDIENLIEASVCDEYFEVSDEELENRKEYILSELSVADREYYTDYYVVKLSHVEAAMKYGISINASKQRKSRMKQRILDLLAVINVNSL